LKYQINDFIQCSPDFGYPQIRIRGFSPVDQLLRFSDRTVEKPLDFWLGVFGLLEVAEPRLDPKEQKRDHFSDRIRQLDPLDNP